LQRYRAWFVVSLCAVAYATLFVVDLENKKSPALMDYH
jgi:hypothetical protein